jgi:hypothetical protein
VSNLIDPTLRDSSTTKICRCIHIGLLCINEPSTEDHHSTRQQDSTKHTTAISTWKLKQRLVTQIQQSKLFCLFPLYYFLLYNVQHLYKFKHREMKQLGYSNTYYSYLSTWYQSSNERPRRPLFLSFFSLLHFCLCS